MSELPLSRRRKKLPVLCPQHYEGLDMLAVPCTRCKMWERGQCTVPTGAEHLPPAVNIPTCPIQDSCQHQIQAGANPCDVRRSGQICESALKLDGIEDPYDHPLSFNAHFVAD